MYKKKNGKGPELDPCGTPAKIKGVLLERYVLNQILQNNQNKWKVT